jgi:hypothetical protein
MTMTPITKKLPLCGLLMLAFSGPTLAQGADIRVCDRPNMNGECVDLRHGVADLRAFGMNNRATSFEIRSGSWLMCSEPGFGGRCVPFDSSVSNLRRSGFNNTVASLRPLRRGDDVGGNNPRSRSAITLYERQNYAGRGWTFTDDEPDLSRYLLNDQVSSVRVHGGRWRLCVDANYGSCRDVEGSVPSLRNIGMRNNTISSIQELRPGRPGETPIPAPTGRVVLYEDGDFRGTELVVDGPVRNLGQFNFNNRVSSLRVPPGERWTVCVGQDFSGQCATVSGDVPSMSRYGMNDRISSLRRVRR